MHSGLMFLSFLGRFLIGIVFIVSATAKVFDWHATEQEWIAVLCDWHIYINFSASLQDCFASALTYVSVLLMAITSFELLGGVLLIFGWQLRFGAFLLILCFLPMTVLFHQFWFLEGAKRATQTVLFTKNLAILGGLFYILAHGSAQKKKKPESSKK